MANDDIKRGTGGAINDSSTLTETPAGSPPTETPTQLSAIPSSAASPPASGPPVSRISVNDIKDFPDKERVAVWLSSLVDMEVARQTFAFRQALAQQFYDSGQFDDAKGMGREQGRALFMVKMQIGGDWGFTNADAVRHIYFTNGRPNVENEMAAAKLQQAGWDWDTEFEWEPFQFKNRPAKRCIGVTLWLKKWDAATRTYKPVLDRKGAPVSESFGEADATTAKIWEKGKQISLIEKWNYQSWPREMFYWRAVSRVRKFHAPNVLRGGILREEALDVITDQAPPDLTMELPAPAPMPAEVPKRPSLKERVMSQPSFLTNEAVPEAKEPISEES